MDTPPFDQDDQPPADSAAPGGRNDARGCPSGCLWGCLGIVALIVLLVGGGIYLTARTLYHTIENDPQISAILDQIRRNPEAIAVIGDDAFVMQFEKRVAPPSGKGGVVTSYDIVLVGDDGLSRMQVRLETHGRDTEIRAIRLTAPDGHSVSLPPPRGTVIRTPSPHAD